MIKVDKSDLDDILAFIQEVEYKCDDIDGMEFGKVPEALDFISSRAGMARRLVDSIIRESNDG